MIKEAFDRAGCAGIIGVGTGSVLAGLFNLLLGPHLFSRSGSQTMLVDQLIAGSLILVLSGLWIVLRSWRP